MSLRFSQSASRVASKQQITDELLIPAIDAYLEDYEAEMTPEENLEALRALREVVEQADVNTIEDIVHSNEGLDALWNGNPDDFRAALDNQISAAEEGFVAEIFADGILRALVGLQRSKLEKLEELLPLCLRRLENVNEYKTDRKMGGKGFLWMFGRVKSRFLPTVKDFNATADSMLNAAKYLQSVSDLSKLDASKVVSCFSGTSIQKAILEIQKKYSHKTTKAEDFTRQSKFSPLSFAFNKMYSAIQHALLARGKFGAAMGVGYALGGLSIGMAVWRKFFSEAEQPIAERGWTVVELKKACTKLMTVVEAVKKANGALSTSISKATAEEKDAAKCATNVQKFIITVTGDLGRGLVAGCKGACSTVLGRMLWHNRINA